MYFINKIQIEILNFIDKIKRKNKIINNYFYKLNKKEFMLLNNYLIILKTLYPFNKILYNIIINIEKSIQKKTKYFLVDKYLLLLLSTKLTNLNL